MEEAADSRVLRDAPSRLPQGQRDAIRTLKLEEMSLKEAAVASGMTVAALEVAVHRGVTLVLTGVPLSLTLLIMLRHAARLAPVPVVMAGSVAV
ncbi:sigma factor-like helix-turn-helix DNA-binding protein, partial [Staphylococcus saprophyticus]